jgi:hypothetical protein
MVMELKRDDDWSQAMVDAAWRNEPAPGVSLRKNVH